MTTTSRPTMARLVGWVRQINWSAWHVLGSRRCRLLLMTCLLLPAWLLPAEAAVAQAGGARLFDVTISLYRSPTGADRAPYERVIEYFADGVYESSNGAHKIRRVSIYSGGRFADQADIVWVASCHPCARVSGRAVLGAHISMCDDFSGTNFLGDDRGWQGGGYTLAHEWGHYFFSLYDEYRGSTATTPWISTPRSGDDPVPNAIMCNQWQARGGNFAWLNFSTAVNNTRNTAQHRVYDASAWETLVRPPTADPKDGQRQALPQRLYYPELAGVAPGSGTAPRIDLPGTARSDLEIIWVDGAVTIQVVLDHSGSMDLEDRMATARAGVGLLVDLASAGQTNMGLIAFDETVTVVQPLATIANQAAKDAFKASLPTIQPDGLTAIGDAARQALKDLVAFAAPGSRQAVYLLTDGKSNAGIDPRTVIAEYKAASVPLFTFGYGTGADTALLQEMAQATGGRYYAAPTTLAGLAQVLSDATGLLTPAVGVSAGERSVAGTTQAAFPIQVDPTLHWLDLVVTYSGEYNAVDLRLLDPLGTPAGAPVCHSAGGETLCLFHVEAPVSGSWQLQATAAAEVGLTYRVNGTGQDTVTYAASLTSLSGDLVYYPDPIVLVAALQRELPIAGANVSATVQQPDGRLATLALLDNGTAPDAIADDGLYSAVLAYYEDGPYTITAQFDNRLGTAHLTYVGQQPAAGENGEQVPFPPPVPIAEPFERFAQLQVNVLGTQSDDHGNTPDAATALPTDNTDMAGRIDRSGDIDLFRLQPKTAGELVVRVSGLALGMDPRLRLLAANGATVLAEGDLTSHPSALGYLLLTQKVAAGDTLYAEVSQRGGASGGLYAISAGEQITSDAPRLRGDLDGDGLCTEADAATALRMASGIEPPDLAADVDGDGDVDETDGLTLMQWAAGGGICEP